MKQLKLPHSLQKYRHYKGNLYRVLCTGKDAKTDEPVVIYQCNKTKLIWVRSAEEFCGLVEKNGYSERRFQLERG